MAFDYWLSQDKASTVDQNLITLKENLSRDNSTSQDDSLSDLLATFNPDPLNTHPKLVNTFSCYLRLLSQPIEIPKGYKLVVLHGGWTSIPKANSDKFSTKEPTPTNPIQDDLLDEELVDWGEDDI